MAQRQLHKETHGIFLPKKETFHSKRDLNETQTIV